MEEWKLDWYNTRGGRTITKPCFGEKVDVLHLFKKDEPKEKIIPKKKSLLEILQAKGYIKTYIETSKGIIISHKVITFRESKNIFKGVKSVYYEDRKGMFSKLFKS
jgi:hypothetical protein